MARNNWFTAVEQTLPEYVPLPMQMLAQASQAMQTRQDTNMANIDAVGTGLASIEARLSGHKQYVDNLTNNYRQEVDSLLTKYNNNATDPQFARDFNRIKTKYANDRNLSTITLANEAAKRNDAIAANLAAEGRLYINPQGTGLDAQGNLISDVGQIRQVNTLADWGNRLKIAADTFNEEGNLITNKTSLTAAKKQIEQSIKDGAPEVTDLVNAYVTRGMSQKDAINQVAQDARRLTGEYAESSKTNWQKLQFEESVRSRREQMALQRAKLRAEQQASNPQMGGQPNMFETTFVEERASTNPLTGTTASFITPTVIELGKTAIKAPVYATTTYSQPITFKPGQALKTGTVHEIHDGTFNNTYRRKNSVTLGKEPLDGGVESMFVFREGKNQGKLLLKDDSMFGFGDDGDGTSSNLNIMKDDSGYYVMDSKKKSKQYVQPQAMRKIIDGDKIYYQELSHEQTIRNMGPGSGYMSGKKPPINKDSQLYKIAEQATVKKYGSKATRADVDATYLDAVDLQLWNYFQDNRGNASTEDSFNKIFGEN